MPIEMVIFFALLTALIVGGLTSGVFLVARELLAEKAGPAPAGWDMDATGRVNLMMWRHEQEKDKKRCPGCGGTRCWDWTREGRSCEENPTLSGSTTDPFAEGRHNKHTVKLVPDGWWPLPKSRFARMRPHLWAMVADHAQILVTYNRKVALP